MSGRDELPAIEVDVVRIADLAEAASDTDYDELVVRADFTQEWVGALEGDQVVSGDVLPLNVDGAAALDVFERMREAFRSAGQPVWSRAEVRVDRSGEARAHFTFPD